MRTKAVDSLCSCRRPARLTTWLTLLLAVFVTLILAPVASATSEASLVMPDLNSVKFMGIGGATLLMGGLVICALGLVFGAVIYSQLKNMPVHQSMREISELIRTHGPSLAGTTSCG